MMMRYMLAAVLMGLGLWVAPCGGQAAGEPAVPELVRGLMTTDLKMLKEAGANACLAWGAPGADEFAALRGAGQFVFVNSLGTPPKEMFEWEGKKRTGMKVPFCYGPESAWGQWWAGHVGTAAAKKWPGILGIVPDEMAWNSGHISYTFGIPQAVGTKVYCDCEVCAQGAGGKAPVTASRFLTDSPEARRFIEYRYQAVADVLKKAQENGKANDPNFLCYYTLNLREVGAMERYPSGVALDVLPQADVLLATIFQTSVDRRGEHSRFMQAMAVKQLLAARPRIGVVLALAATVYDYGAKQDWTQSYYWRKEVEDLLPGNVVASIRQDMRSYTMRDDEVILPAVSAIAHGAKGVMFFVEEKAAAMKEVFAMMTALEKPLAGASVPGEVVVVVSRVSEDRWMLSHAPEVGSRDDFSDAMMQDGCWAQPSDRIAWEFNKDKPHSQGFRSTAAAMEALIRLGIPFRAVFAEGLRADDLKEAKAVVVPFCTHLSQESARLLQASSAKLVVYAHRGEMDEKGNPRAMDALASGMFVKEEASEALASVEGRTKLAEMIGDAISAPVSGGGEDVERTWLKLPGGGVALFCINWGEKPATLQWKRVRADADVLDAGGKRVTPPVGTGMMNVPARDVRVVISGR